MQMIAKMTGSLYLFIFFFGYHMLKIWTAKGVAYVNEEGVKGCCVMKGFVQVLPHRYQLQFLYARNFVKSNVA